MNIVVCIKQVPSTEAAPRPSPKPPFIDTTGLSWVINPFDEYAIEEAIRIKERQGKGEVTVITLGPESAKEALMGALAMGADRALHIIGETHLGVDSYATAYLLCQAIKGRPFDLILCGKEAVDDQNGAVGIQLAELLNIPHVAVITRLSVDAAGKAVIHRQIEGGTEVLECQLPALLTCQKGLNEPRYPSLPGIMKAKNKPYEAVPATGLAPQEVWGPGARVSVKEVSLLPTRKVGRKLQGGAAEMVEDLVKFIREGVSII
ncbi:MAG TPA: electron transfer flavoprotein subunit beta/FixA family protein [Candidatus Tripitaka californicus]|uniref:electron transfer flavoprotein subunit beta/FixA family protein n=3 Tax=Candidatus Tripitaka californicus TaxID=3367616 RepID=UPI004025ED87|nr:electron transfer flavoprotein subunit beta/FixA family protein [Planctomycetota bacterium]